jgi:hypothetical protein
VILADDLVQPLRAQSVGERGRRLRRQARSFEEIGHGRACSKWIGAALERDSRKWLPVSAPVRL